MEGLFSRIFKDIPEIVWAKKIFCGIFYWNIHIGICNLLSAKTNKFNIGKGMENRSAEKVTEFF